MDYLAKVFRHRSLYRTTSTAYRPLGDWGSGYGFSYVNLIWPTLGPHSSEGFIRFIPVNWSSFSRIYTVIPTKRLDLKDYYLAPFVAYSHRAQHSLIITQKWFIYFCNMTIGNDFSFKFKQSALIFSQYHSESSNIFICQLFWALFL